MIHSSEMDFLTLIEHDFLPILAFRTREDMECWAGSVGLSERRIGRRSPKNIVVLSGQIETLGGARLFYSQIWARARYGDYRKAVVSYIKDTERGECNVSGYDVDHAISRNLLMKYGQDSWVNLLLVDGWINRAIGSMMEKVYRVPDEDQIPINVECLLKVFYRKKGRMRKELLEDYFEEAGRRFISRFNSLEGFFAKMSADGMLNDIAEDCGLKRPPRKPGLYAIRMAGQ